MDLKLLRLYSGVSVFTILICCMIIGGVAASETAMVGADTTVPAGRNTAIYIASNPVGATIFLDGVEAGITNRMITAAEGEHTLKLTLEGYYDYEETITVKYPVVKLRAVRLKALPKTTGEVRIVTMPTKAFVYVDGVFLGSMGATVKKLSPGKHSYFLRKKGYNDVSGNFIVNAGKTTYLAKILAPGNKTLPQPPVVCNQPYGLCTTAKCEILPSDPTKAICEPCYIEDGVSSGLSSCDNRKTVGMYNSSTNGWMISAGSQVGQITSTYSFINSVPTEQGKIPNRYIDPSYTGNIILKLCNAPAWANCLDMKCVVPPADPEADVSVDRKAADYAICECAMVNDEPDFYMAASEGEASCTDPEVCRKNIWSAAFIDVMLPGINTLKAYLAAHPTQDTAQQYTMPICPVYNSTCSNCSSCR